jgi:diguanylate cyclase (GGDEF)-like protein
MHLDMLTMAAVNVTVTAVLGLVLIFTWGRERANSFVGWWGLAQLVMSAGVLIAVVLWRTNHAALVPVGSASMILANALQWKASCQFEHRPAHPLWIIAGPIAFLLAAPSGLLGPFDGRLILLCTLIATYNFAAAIELAHGYRERLRSRWPAVVMLIAAGALYLSWLPLILTLPIHEAGLVFVSSWFAMIVLVNLSVRTALAFIVLAMAKERRELERRLDALTDPLTGLPNRRALIEAAEELRQQGDALRADPISVLLFDLDHFKEINDAYGHRFGDHVLKLFAATLSQQLDGDTILARLGGEEFAAILRGANPVAAVEAAESVRSAFETSAALVDGVAVGGTVSVGAASDAEIKCDIGMLFHRADAALYMAKSAGRNRVELVGPDQISDLDELGAALRSSTAELHVDAAITEYHSRLTA